MKTLVTLAALSFSSAAFCQTLAEIEAQDFAYYQSPEFGISAIYPTIGFHKPDLPPFPEGLVFYAQGTDIFLRFRVYDLEDLGPREYLAKIRREIVESGREFLSEDFDNNGTLFGWSDGARHGEIKVVFRADCPLVAVLRLEYPAEERAKMEAYFEALALSFVLGPSNACPDPIS